MTFGPNKFGWTYTVVKVWTCGICLSCIMLTLKSINSCFYSNPPVQAQALEYNSLPLLSTLLSSSEPDQVQRRALFALNALLRGNYQEQLNFIKTHRGLSVLGSRFEERGPQVQLKAVVLLTDLLNDEVCF